VLRAFGPTQDQRQGEEQQPEQSAGSHWMKGDRAVVPVQALSPRR
jgi:hypothetical protein